VRPSIVLAGLALIAAPACTVDFVEPVPGCESFADDFADGRRDDFWQPNSFDDPPATLEETGGELRISPAPGEAAALFAGYLGDDFDFTHRSARIRVLELPNPTTHAQLIFKLEFPFPDFAGFIVEAGVLRARVDVDGAPGDLMTAPYDPARHRLLRLRHRDGVVSFDTSPDGLAWTTLATHPMLDLTFARLGILAGTYQPETAPGVARFDDLLVACR
jgi:hypothetical protein